MSTGILYIVATPIGNLGDLTFRALETLKKADLIVCEDTRNTKKLLDKYAIATPLACFYKKGGKGAIKPGLASEFVIANLRNGKNVALVTDAGTPGISDPGNLLVEKAIENQIPVIPIPGASALTALASVSGIDLSKFVFLGFPPHKKGRMTFIADIFKSNYPVIIYESKYRILKLLKELSGYSGEKRINLIIGRELTKMYEEIIKGDVETVIKYFLENKQKNLGEFTVIIYK
ncbi:MAG: 16S rRNA (cytidine(1402)-2'-O)-methyltransferase [Candidatus Moranbacteria bacterium]|nr:16S rRNA (cytidine(1402)-2'-O)-methyltransferase [Candidatus Moranbacteria bacterium]